MEKTISAAVRAAFSPIAYKCAAAHWVCNIPADYWINPRKYRVTMQRKRA